MDMKHDVFGEITFNIGWKAKRNLHLFDKKYQINLKIKAYYEEDGITSEQEKAYIDFYKHEEKNLEAISKLLLSYDNAAEERFIPRTLIFERDGALALLCDDEDKPDEGIAVCIYPEIKIISQDEYL